MFWRETYDFLLEGLEVTYCEQQISVTSHAYLHHHDHRRDRT
jgi:hypothetical protein